MTYITNTGFDTWSEQAGKWYTKENEDRDSRQSSTLLLTIAFAAQLIIYYKLWDDAIEERDKVIDKQKVILDYIHRKDIDVDYPFLQLKQDVLNLPIPEPEKCADAVKHNTPILQMGSMVDECMNKQSLLGSNGIPTTWKPTSHLSFAVKSAINSGSVLSASGKRREETFRDEKTSLVLHAQGATQWNITPALRNYTQAISIFEGLAQIFAGGFNSAGVGLGTVWGRAANQSSGGRG